MGMRAVGIDRNGVPTAGPAGAWRLQARLLGISESERDPVRIISSAQVRLRMLRRFPEAVSPHRTDAAVRIRLIMDARDALLRSAFADSVPVATSDDRGAV